MSHGLGKPTTRAGTGILLPITNPYLHRRYHGYRWISESTVPQSKSIMISLSVPPLTLPGTSQLTKVWTTTYLPPHLKHYLISTTTPTIPLSMIKHLVLINLLSGVGIPCPHMHPYFPDTALSRKWWLVQDSFSLYRLGTINIVVTLPHRH